MYQRLVLYKQQHGGDTAVPYKYIDDPRLGKWVHTQRRAKKDSRLLSERMKLLDAIGFDWGAGDARSNRWDTHWDTMYQKLIEYKKQHNGDTNVPNKNSEQHKALGTWVSTQRTYYNKNRLSVKRIHLLNSIDFDWGTPIVDNWSEMYQRLITYKNRYGNAKIGRAHV